jgi:hypothetical protein
MIFNQGTDPRQEALTVIRRPSLAFVREGFGDFCNCSNHFPDFCMRDSCKNLSRCRVEDLEVLVRICCVCLSLNFQTLQYPDETRSLRSVFVTSLQDRFLIGCFGMRYKLVAMVMTPRQRPRLSLALMNSCVNYSFFGSVGCAHLLDNLSLSCHEYSIGQCEDLGQIG